MTHPKRGLALVCALALLGTACGGDDDTTESADQPEVAATATPGDVDPPEEPPEPDSEPESEAEPEPEPEAPPEGLRAVVEETVTLLPSDEPGPHPTLSWEPVEGAASYWLVATDADGITYWAWTGSATTLRFGGGDTADRNQTAAVHEPLTWTVSAFDADGTLLAISDPGTLEP